MNRHTAKSLLVLALAFTLAVPAARAQDDETVSVPLSDPSKPSWVRVGLTMGSIFVEAYDGKDVVVTIAEKMEPVKKERDVRSDGLRRIPNTSHGLTLEERDNRVKISTSSWNRATRLVVKVPRRTSLDLKTVNDGDVEVRGVAGELELGNANGSITALDVSGSVVANTLNGDIKITFTSVTPDKPMAFSNLNGDIDVTFPANLKADLRMRTDMGDILTDFDLDVVATTQRKSEGGDGKGFHLKIEKQIEAKVGGGGPEITFKNFNGDILIRKGG